MHSRGSGVTACVGWRRPRARRSDLALHSVPLTYGGTGRVWTRIRAGKPRAPGMSKDTRYRVRGTLAAPTRMQPEEKAPVIPSGMLSGGSLMPKCPLARSPHDGESAPPRHEGDRRRHDLAPPTRRPTLFTRAGATASSTPCSSAAPRATCTTPTPAVSPGSNRSPARADKHTRAHAVRGMRTRLAAPGAVW